jgi:hypothetical protein
MAGTVPWWQVVDGRRGDVTSHPRLSNRRVRRLDKESEQIKQVSVSTQKSTGRKAQIEKEVNAKDEICLSLDE